MQRARACAGQESAREAVSLRLLLCSSRCRPPPASPPSLHTQPLTAPPFSLCRPVDAGSHAGLFPLVRIDGTVQHAHLCERGGARSSSCSILSCPPRLRTLRGPASASPELLLCRRLLRCLLLTAHAPAGLLDRLFERASLTRLHATPVPHECERTLFVASLERQFFYQGRSRRSHNAGLRLTVLRCGTLSSLSRLLPVSLNPLAGHSR